MNKLSIATVCATVVAASAINNAPVNAITLTKLDISGTVTVSSKSLPLLTGQPATKVKQKINLDVIIDNLAKRLEDQNNSDLTFPIFGYLDQYFPQLFPQLPSGFSITAFSGEGSIFSDAAKTNLLSGFYWSYNAAQDIVTVDGYDFSSIELCLETTCYLSGASNQFGISASGVVLNNVKMKFNVAQTATTLGSNQFQQINSRSFNLSQSETESVPEPSTLWGSITALGLGLLFKRKLSKKLTSTNLN